MKLSKKVQKTNIKSITTDPMSATDRLIKLSDRLSQISESRFFLHFLEKKLLHFRINQAMYECFPHMDSMNASRKKTQKFKK